MSSTTEHPSMNVIIHAAFRRDLHRFDAALGAWPEGSETRAGEIATAWDNFAVQLHHHHHDEETIFFPVLRTLGATRLVDGRARGRARTNGRRARTRR